MTKAISEYSEIKGQPHVTVAKKMKELGKSESELVNNFIPYVICKVGQVDSKPNSHLADKAFHPDEVMNPKNKLDIDIDYYIAY